MLADFVKSSDEGVSNQLTHYAEKLVEVGASLGFTPADIAAAQTDASVFSFATLGQTKSQAYSQAFTTYKNHLRTGDGTVIQALPTLDLGTAPATLVANGVITRFRKSAARAKTSTNYTEAIGVQLGIVGATIADTDINAAKPPIIGLAMAGSKVLVKWKKGRFDGIKIFRKIGNGEYVEAGVDTKPDWLDSRPLPTVPEVWTYKLVYFLDDSEIGVYSDESSITVSAS